MTKGLRHSMIGRGRALKKQEAFLGSYVCARCACPSQTESNREMFGLVGAVTLLVQWSGSLLRKTVEGVREAPRKRAFVYPNGTRVIIPA